MTETKLCEPCRRLLVGDLPVHIDKECLDEIKFDHHINYDSYKEAMQLPCSICTLAWLNAKDSPLEFNSQKFTATYIYYSMGCKLTLLFSAAHHDSQQIDSARLFLERISSSSI